MPTIEYTLYLNVMLHYMFFHYVHLHGWTAVLQGLTCLTEGVDRNLMLFKEEAKETSWVVVHETDTAACH